MVFLNSILGLSLIPEFKIRRLFRFWFWRNVHILPAICLAMWQSIRLRVVLGRAKRLGMYEKLLKSSSTLPHKDNLIKLSKFPITNKKNFQIELQENYLATSNPRWRYTSGTTGEPFRFVSADFDMMPDYNDAMSYRFLYDIFSPAYIRNDVKIVLIRMDYTPSKSRLFIPTADFLKDPTAACELIDKFHGDVVVSYPSILVELSSLVRKKGLTLKFRYAVSYGEMLDTENRAFIENTLHCELFNRYGLEELGAIGVECCEHNGFHLNTESFIMEIVDQQGSPCVPGKEGRIIITDLNNMNMPFVRYDTGDRGRVICPTCVCGNPALRFTVEGRLGVFLSIAGRKILHLEFDKVFGPYSGEIMKYQIVKVSDEFLRVIIIPGPAYYENVSEEVKKKLSELIGQSIRMSIVVSPSLYHLENGKSSTIIDKTRRPGRPGRPMTDGVARSARWEADRSSWSWPWGGGR